METCSLRLDLLRPRVNDAISGTAPGASGVVPADPSIGASRSAPPRSRLGTQALAAILIAGLSLLGQGERFRLDPRFRSPSATLNTFWESLRQGDGDGAYECMVEGRHDLPMPGALWFLPPTDDLWLEGFRSLPVTAGRVMVSYEVHYRPLGLHEERMFKTGSELVRLRGEWRIAQPLGEVSMPDWTPVPSPVDI